MLQTSQSLIQSIFWYLLRRPYEVISSDIHRIHWTSWTRSINSLGDKINSAFSFCLVERYLKKKQIRKEFPTFYFIITKTRGFDLSWTFKKIFSSNCVKCNYHLFWVVTTYTVVNAVKIWRFLSEIYVSSTDTTSA